MRSGRVLDRIAVLQSCDLNSSHRESGTLKYELMCRFEFLYRELVQTGLSMDKSLQDESGGVTRCAKWQMFLLVGGGVFLCTMDSSMVNVALPSIMRTFSVPLIVVQWVVLVYLLTVTVSLLFWGVAADRWGRGGIFLTGLVLFAGSSAGCAMAPKFAILIGMRFIEGSGAAMMMASGPAIIRNAFPPQELGKGLGLIGIATSVGLMSGPAVSGMIIDHFSWRGIFMVTVPLSLIIWLAGLKLFRSRGFGRDIDAPRWFDIKGTVLWLLLVLSLILYAHYFMLWGWVARFFGALWLVLTIALFVWAERTRKSSILPLHLFTKSYYHIGLITAGVSFASLFVVLVLMPFYLDYMRHLSADLIGLVMMSVPVTLSVVSPASGVLFDRLGGRWLTTIGLTVSFLALLALAQIKADSSLMIVCVDLAFLGMGQSMFLSPNTASLLSRITDADAGVTSGLLATSRNLGMLIGAAFAGIVFAGWFSWFSGGGELGNYAMGQRDFFMAALQATFFCAAAFSLVAVIISWRRER